MELGPASPQSAPAPADGFKGGQNIQRDLKEPQERKLIIGEGAIRNRRYRLNEVNQQSLSI